MKKASVALFTTLALVSLVLFNYTNCSPIHEHFESADKLSFGFCDEHIEAFADTFLASIDGGELGCLSCHNSLSPRLQGDENEVLSHLISKLGNFTNVRITLFNFAEEKDNSHKGRRSVGESEKLRLKELMRSFQEVWGEADEICTAEPE